MPPIDTRDTRIPTAHGSLHTRRWTPSGTAARALSPFVLLHDSLGCIELWRDFPAQLAARSGREVIAYDRLGFGRSDPHPGSLGIDFVSTEARGSFRAICEALAIERCIVFGHSVGGGMAVACAAAHPARCVGLVTESAQALVETCTRDGIREAERLFEQPGQFERLERYHGDKARWVLRAWVDTWLSPAFADWHLDGELAGVGVPVLAIHGEQDEYGSSRQPRRIVEGVAGSAALCLLEGCGHVPHREQPEPVLAALEGWLAAHPSLA